MDRASGILMPIFSLPSPYGIGTFGKEAYEFVDYLYKAGVKYWQVLPLHPLTFGNSPYQSTSTYAGNMFLIDLDTLVKEGLLKKSRFENIDFGSDKNRMDYIKLVAGKKEVLRDAAKEFIRQGKNKGGEAPVERRQGFVPSYQDFLSEYSYFLDEFAVFDLLKDRNSGKPFSQWDRLYRLHYDDVIKELAKGNPHEIEVYKIVQYFFFKQWLSLKKYANDKGIKIIGDMPIYSSLDSVEVFSDYKNFNVDDDRRPYEVAGCPPDAFSADGQNWGNPLYNYDYMRNDSYRYFVKRIGHLSKLYDVIRIDHFRGFANYYAIPASETTAKNGMWKTGPGIELFNIVEKEVPGVKIIAEDLGYIDEPVLKLLADTGYPGMKVVEFAFGGADVENHQYLPKNYNENSVAYLGTHDNDTFMGWYEKLTDEVKEQVDKYLHLESGNECEGAIRELYKSKSNLTIITMQDLLALGTETRINTPSTVGVENWSYRFDKDYLDKKKAEFLKKVITETNR